MSTKDAGDPSRLAELQRLHEQEELELEVVFLRAENERLKAQAAKGDRLDALERNGWSLEQSSEGTWLIPQMAKQALLSAITGKGSGTWHHATPSDAIDAALAADKKGREG